MLEIIVALLECNSHIFQLWLDFKMQKMQLNMVRIQFFFFEKY